MADSKLSKLQAYAATLDCCDPIIYVADSVVYLSVRRSGGTSRATRAIGLARETLDYLRRQLAAIVEAF